MNKKLKNVLAFGLATSFVLTSTMGISATGDAVSYDDVTSYAATDSSNWITVRMYLTYEDESGNQVGSTVKQYTVCADATADAYQVDVTDVPDGYEIITNNHLYIEGYYAKDWTADAEGYPSGSQTIYVKPVKAPVVEDVTTDVIVNFRDVDTDTYVTDDSGLYKTWTTSYTFKPGADEGWADISGVEIPAGYEAVTTPDVVTVYVNNELKNYVTVDVKKVKAPVVEDVTTDVIVNFYDVDAKDTVKGDDGKEITWSTTYTFKPGSDEGWADISGVEIPAGYEALTTPDVATVYVNNELKNYVTVDVKKKETPAPAPTAVTKVLKVNFWDIDTNSQVGDVVSLKHEFEATSAADATFTFAATSVEAPEGYTVVKQPALILHKDYEEDWVTIDVKKVTEDSKAVTKVLKVNFWDVDTNSQVGDVVSLEHEFEATSEDNATFTFAATSVEAPEGYMVINQPALILHKDYEEDWVTIDVQKIKNSEAVEKVLHVNFWDVDANKQVGDVLELKHEFEADSAADATYTFAATSVEAPVGYTTVKQPELILHKDYEEDWVTIDVKKNDAAEAVEKVLHVNFWDVDANVQVGNIIELTHVFEAGSADDATFTFAGTSVEAPKGYMAVKQPALTLHKAYEEDWVTIDVQKVEEVQKTVKVVFSVDPAKGEFPGYDGATTIHYTIDEDSAEQYLVPEVKAADGYKFVGWQVEGKESGRWDADAKTFGVTGLAFYPEGSNEGYVSIDAIFEATETEPEVQKTVKVVFSVDPAKGEFPGYDGSTTIHYTIDEYSAEQYLVPEVKAADGYKFVGWQVEGKESGRWDAEAKTFL